MGDLEPIETAIARTQRWLLAHQYPEGYWWGELESNVCMAAEYLLMTHFLGVSNPQRWRKIATYLRRQQLADGTWSIYYGGPPDINATVEAYFALKLAGASPQEPGMAGARSFILSRGGVQNARIFTKIWLALFGQYDWRRLPAMSPEIIFLPSWFPFNIYEFGSWARPTLVAMLVILTLRPTCPLPDHARLDELHGHDADRALRPSPQLLSWRNFFLAADQIARLYERLPAKPWRRRALEAVERWIVQHQEADGSWGGIQPPWVYSLMALKALGYPKEHPVIQKGLAGLEGAFAVEDEEVWHHQACLSPVWDTGLAMMALQDAGLAADHPALVQAARWLLREQVLTGGDWQVKNRRAKPGGWAFEFENDLYPDVDDTAYVMLPLLRTQLPEEEQPEGLAAGHAHEPSPRRVASGDSQPPRAPHEICNFVGAPPCPNEKGEALGRGLRWLLSMQSRNGGWASFDVDNTKSFVTQIPFADFGATIDPPTVDVTAHVLELLGHMGYRRNFPPVGRALAFIRREQEADGCWWGRWGVNYIYGTGAVLPALKALGEPMDQPYVRRAVEWLLARQNPDGGWGESCASYADPSLRSPRATSTASQTAWALLALLAADDGDSAAVQRGIDYLLKEQQEDGSWEERYFTGTGFPKDFFINYHLYRIYFPLMALGRYRAHRRSRCGAAIRRIEAERGEG